jgi:hypothetical protein
MHRLGAKASAGDQPGDHRVGIPHLACLALVASPDEWRHGGHDIARYFAEKRRYRWQADLTSTELGALLGL